MPIDPAPVTNRPPVMVPLSKVLDVRTAPVVGTDGHLPPVPEAALRPDAIRARFARPAAWEPEVWQEPQFMDRPPTPAAVLVPIVMRARPTVLLTERTPHLSTHSGQIAFPGGRTDDSDRDATHTALREAQEEIGLDPSLPEVVGTLSVYKTGSQFLVTPVVALIPAEHALALNTYEVADAFEVPLDFLMNPTHHRRHEIFWEGVHRKWFSMPYMDGGTERFVWGATAGMLRNLYRFLSA